MSTITIRKSPLTGPIAVVITLSLLYWLDNVLMTWRRYARDTFNMQPFYYFLGVLLILFAMLMIFLTWLLLVYSRPSRFTSIFSLVIGTFILGLLFANFSANPVLESIINLEPLTRIWYVISSRGFESMTLQAGAFIFVIGLIDLIRGIRAETLHNRGTNF